MHPPPTPPHPWQFFRAGGVDQVIIRSGEDIARLPELDQKLWVALACPTRGIEFDERTLDLIDTDHDGRIRPPELLAACAWACAQLRDPAELTRPGDTLDIAAIDDSTDPGAALAGAARRILAMAGSPDATAISLAEVVARSEQLSTLRFNGDGIITVETAQGDALARTAIEHILKTQGSTPPVGDPPLPGIDRARAEAFFADLDKIAAWAAKARDATTALALGEHTLRATEAMNAVAHKVEDFFARSRLAAYDLRAATALNPSLEEYTAMARQELDLSSSAIATLPLAPITPRGLLPLTEGVNPAWAAALHAFRDHAVVPLLGHDVDTLTQEGWHTIAQALAPCQQWLKDRPATAVDTLGDEVLTALHATDARQRVIDLIADDEAEQTHNAHTKDLEKLLRFKRDLLELLNNFVSFSAFYQRRGAIFQAGTLYLDARSCDLTVQVADAAQHAKLAGLAKTYLAYCQCTRKGQKMGIVAAFTAGDVDFLFVGRNGVFYDRKGQDWDATITRIVENPTSIGQAFLSPYKKFVRLIEEQVAKRAAAGEARAQKSLGATASSLANTPLKAAGTAPADAVTATVPRRTDVGTVAAIGVALGSISAVLVGVFAKFVDLGVWIPLALAGIVLAISGPSMLIAWLKLRQRSLGPLLDASGWAINGRMRINTRLGSSLSQTAKVPATARRTLQDPFAESKAPLWWSAAALVVVVALGVAAWRLQWFDRWTTAPARAPAATAPAPASAASSAATAPPATGSAAPVNPATALPAATGAAAASSAR
ncbi:hypothetical protein ASF11_05245 [Acidovorax sp. Leaf76]|uniref:hypothetical protein n=1 Tax=unclassified Acidovorax TaxID=2684926 RepID=UPI0007007BF5|nr:MULTISPECIES: hypothetical protein [unclassified Acidovorax]KQO21831.1 hypothetical protein ASF11_05245 [Acidovorax sp. Leaf76]KQO34901.1 hypothetical protein ASF19_04120 [Acidovorax sp. Leaf84]KQS34687.1 hypothetical protein ASG27_04360 [Acidovorax sp. Leaf191]